MGCWLAGVPICCSLSPPTQGDCRKVTWPTFALFSKNGLPKPRKGRSLQSYGKAVLCMRTAPSVVWARACKCYCNTDQSEACLSLIRSQVCCVTSCMH